MRKKTLKDFDFKGKKALVRVDFNVPLADGKITDDTRIQAALPTIQYLINEGARVILMSHLGRPKGQVNDAYRMDPVAQRLAELLNKEVTKVDDCIGPEVEEAVSKMKDGDVLLLEIPVSIKKRQIMIRNLLRNWPVSLMYLSVMPLVLSTGLMHLL